MTGITSLQIDPTMLMVGYFTVHYVSFFFLLIPAHFYRVILTLMILFLFGISFWRSAIRLPIFIVFNKFSTFFYCFIVTSLINIVCTKLGIAFFVYVIHVFFIMIVFKFTNYLTFIMIVCMKINYFFSNSSLFAFRILMSIILSIFLFFIGRK